MKCKNCLNTLKSSYSCKYCQNNFCSLSCLEIHFSEFHKLLNNNNDNLIPRNKNQISSPFIVKGEFKNTIIYNSIYSLENFVLIYDQNGKLKVIGKGSYGEVYLGVNSIDKKYYAIKHMDKKFIYKYLHSLTSIQKEIEIQSRIDHPNIVKLLYVKETNISYDLVLEYAPEGNLFHFIRKNKGLSEDKAFGLFIQVVNAINFLHENDLIHRDIKPENILMYENNVIKLCDFGCCVKLEGQQRGTFCGTTEYMSPELLKNKGYGKEIDVWSIGILLYEMIHGYSPFRPNKPHFREKDVMENIIKHKIKFHKNISDECKKLIYGLLETNINKRYKIEDIYNSEFVKKYEKMKIDNESMIINEKNFISQSQINNIPYYPLNIEVDSNINIYKSMNFNQSETKNISNFQGKNNIKERNQSFPKTLKGISINYMSPNIDIGNLSNRPVINNNFFNNDLNGIINDNMNINKINNINNIISNISFNSNDNESITFKKNKLTSNKTLDNYFSSYTVEKKIDQELIDEYISKRGEKFPEDTKRENKNSINNSPINLYEFNSENKIFTNDNLINIKKSQIYNSSYNHYIQFSGISGINEEKKHNNKDFINKMPLDLIGNSNISSSNNQSDDTKNLIYDYYYNSNDYPNNNLINNNKSPLYSSLIKKTQLNLLDNNYNLNSLIKSNNKDKILNLSKVPKTPTRIIFKNKINKKISNNFNNNYLNNNSIIFKNKKIVTDTKKENINNNNYSHKLDYSDINKKQKNTEKEKKEKEPADNTLRKNKRKKENEDNKIKGVNISININKNINSSYRLNKNNKEFISDNKKEKKNSFNEINGFYKNISFDQPNVILPLEKKKSNMILKSKSFSNINQFNKFKRSRNKNNNSNFYKEKMNLSYDKIIDEKKNELNTHIKRKNLYMQKTDNQKKNNKTIDFKTVKDNKKNNINKKEKNEHNNNNNIYKSQNLINDLDNKKTKKNEIKKNNNKNNIFNSMNNEISTEKALIFNRLDKNPKVKNICHYKKNTSSFNGYKDNFKLINEKNKTNNINYIQNNINTNNKQIKSIQENYKIEKNDKYLRKINSTDEKLNSIYNKNNYVDNNNNEKNIKKDSYSKFEIENQKYLKPKTSLNNFNDKIKIESINININKIKKDKINEIDDDYNLPIYKTKNKLSKRKGIIPFDSDRLNQVNLFYENDGMNDDGNITPKKKSIFNKVKPNKLLEAFRKELSDCKKKENF